MENKISRIHKLLAELNELGIENAQNVNEIGKKQHPIECYRPYVWMKKESFFKTFDDWDIVDDDMSAKYSNVHLSNEFNGVTYHTIINEEEYLEMVKKGA